jgi:hypothetical protein
MKISMTELTYNRALTVALSLAALLLPAVARAAHGAVSMPTATKPVKPGGSTTTPPPGDGETTVVGTKIIHTFEPLALTPIGTPVEPLAAQSEWDKFKNMMLSALAKVDTKAGDDLAQVQAVRAAIQDRDVRVASQNLPKRVAVAAK